MARRKFRRKNRPLGKKDPLVAYLLLIPPLGTFGLHKFYMNQPLWGLAYFFTSGFLGLGLIYDLLTIPRQVEDCNRMLEWKGSSSIQIEINSDFSGRNDEYDDVIEADYEYIKSEAAAQKKASGRYEKAPETKTLEARVLEIADRADMHQVSLKDLIREVAAG